MSYGFYKKPMASKLIMRASTVIPNKMKHENAANELIRRVLNTRRGMNGYKEEKLLVTNAFMVTLQLSGYSEGFRHQTALAAFRGVRRMEEREAGGGRRVYRLQTEGAVARHRARLSAKSTWFKKKRVEEEPEWEDGGGGGRRKKSPKQPSDDNTAKKSEDGAVNDDRQVEGIIFAPFTTGSKLRYVLVSLSSSK